MISANYNQPCFAPLDGAFELADVEVCPGSAQNKALSAFGHDRLVQPVDLRTIRNEALCNNVDVCGEIQDKKVVVDLPEVLAPQKRSIKEVEGDFVPAVIRRASADNGLAFWKGVIPTPEFTFEGFRREAGCEPSRRVDRVPIPSEKLAAGPVRPDPVQLFGNEPLHDATMDQTAAQSTSKQLRFLP